MDKQVKDHLYFKEKVKKLAEITYLLDTLDMHDQDIMNRGNELAIELENYGIITYHDKHLTIHEDFISIYNEHMDKLGAKSRTISNTSIKKGLWSLLAIIVSFVMFKACWDKSGEKIDIIYPICGMVGCVWFLLLVFQNFGYLTNEE